MSSSPTVSQALPNKDDERAFCTLVFDRQRAFMVAEIVGLRDTLMGPSTLIAQAKANPDPNMMHSVFVSGGLMVIFEQLFRYVDAMATGDAVMRWLGHLESVAPFGSEQSLHVCNLKRCTCNTTLKRTSIISFIKSQHKPNWQPFLDYIETQRVTGRINVGKSSRELRLHTQRTLDQLNEQFLQVINERLEGDLEYPLHDRALLRDEAAFYPLLDRAEPLPNAVLQSLRGSSDPSSYDLVQLEELRRSGKSVRECIARMRRKEGNRIFTQAAEVSSVQAEKMFEHAEQLWTFTIMQGGIEAIALLCNVAALALQQKR